MRGSLVETSLFAAVAVIPSIFVPSISSTLPALLLLGFFLLCQLALAYDTKQNYIERNSDSKWLDYAMLHMVTRQHAALLLTPETITSPDLLTGVTVISPHLVHAIMVKGRNESEDGYPDWSTRRYVAAATLVEINQRKKLPGDERILTRDPHRLCVMGTDRLSTCGLWPQHCALPQVNDIQEMQT